MESSQIDACSRGSDSSMRRWHWIALALAPALQLAVAGYMLRVSVRLEATDRQYQELVDHRRSAFAAGEIDGDAQDMTSNLKRRLLIDAEADREMVRGFAEAFRGLAEITSGLAATHLVVVLLVIRRVRRAVPVYGK